MEDDTNKDAKLKKGNDKENYDTDEEVEMMTVTKIQKIMTQKANIMTLMVMSMEMVQKMITPKKRQTIIKLTGYRRL